jgi:hypothetical protein
MLHATLLNFTKTDADDDPAATRNEPPQATRAPRLATPQPQYYTSYRGSMAIFLTCTATNTACMIPIPSPPQHPPALSPPGKLTKKDRFRNNTDRSFRKEAVYEHHHHKPHIPAPMYKAALVGLIPHSHNSLCVSLFTHDAVRHCPRARRMPVIFSASRRPFYHILSHHTFFPTSPITLHRQKRHVERQGQSSRAHNLAGTTDLGNAVECGVGCEVLRRGSAETRMEMRCDIDSFKGLGIAQLE